ncbi:hypothetical protein MCESLAEM7_00123 [Candidatus Pelagibacterales bacterium]|jgi:hypothetical protein
MQNVSNKGSVSDKKIKANRENAKKSTGPIHWWTKNRVRGNALTHGLTADKILIIGENTREFENYRKSMISMLDPLNVEQEEMALHIIMTGWKIRRVSMVETGIYGSEILDGNSRFDKENFLTRKVYHDDFTSDHVQEVKRYNELAGFGLIRDCNGANAIIKINTIEQRLLNRYYSLIENYKALKHNKKTIEE